MGEQFRSEEGEAEALYEDRRDERQLLKPSNPPRGHELLQGVLQVLGRGSQTPAERTEEATTGI